MAPPPLTLQVGATVRFDGDTHQVVGLDGTSTTLRSYAGRHRVVLTSQLLSDASFSLGAQKPDPEPALGALMTDLTRDVNADMKIRTAHLDELLQGLPRPDDPHATEPRTQYRPEVKYSLRLQAKAQELGVTERTLRRWVNAYRDRGAAGAIDHRRARLGTAGNTIAPEWTAMAREVFAEYTKQSRPTKLWIMQLIRERLDERYGEGVIKAPGMTAAYAEFKRMTKGTNTFTGSTSQKRSIAAGPTGVYGSLTVTRPGEYLILDTNLLDVYAMDTATQTWVRVEMTIAMDLFPRTVPALALRPESTKSIDVASVLFEAIHPQPRANGPMSQRPYSGVPSAIICGDDGRHTTAIETIVVDHGRAYLSDHVRSVCTRLGISIQPARPRTPTDKGPLERFFGTLNDDLLQKLPGYKGPDIYSRGLNPENDAFYTIEELDKIIRQWVDDAYHQRPHDGLVVPAAPHVPLSPNDMHELGIATAGYLRILPDPNLAFDFLPTAWRTIPRYGIELHGLIYNGEAINEYRGTPSPYTGAHRGKWPVRYNPNDIRYVYFQDPVTYDWHRLEGTQVRHLNAPMSLDQWDYVKRLALREDQDPIVVGTRRIEQWAAGDYETRTERRMGLQQALHHRSLALQPATAEEEGRRLSVVDGDEDAYDPELWDEDGESAADVYDDLLEILA